MDMIQNVDGQIWVNGAPLPIGSDSLFKPTPEFWDAWHADKYAVKRAGLSIRPDGNDGWQGIYNPSAPPPVMSERELHQQWIASARQLVADGTASAFFSKLPYNFDLDALDECHLPECGSRCAIVVSAIHARNDTFQLRLMCGGCERKGSQLKWSLLGRDLVVAAIAACLRADAEGVADV